MDYDHRNKRASSVELDVEKCDWFCPESSEMLYLRWLDCLIDYIHLRHELLATCANRSFLDASATHLAEVSFHAVEG